ncbi:uncharacterized protein LAESUDRAFT_734670 [Laetiporus sulphureus 93-53]|uniref:DASH complex subunit DUO1 n=1 Tax=Laetiporus sulphureus 93-53 TaxID=1314785 RepID=A0A165GXJ6_9APHY|nr:uncharacterized protein LAESUDRAFT_734670 [Laetiporus sulphureus 93-53]KZT10964.1 hypothetical protein LAESUDRAFT_734670 [Laetiporus sulphureus 93-53]
MDSPNISELNLQDGSHLLSETSLVPNSISSSSRTESGRDDLLLSDLSLSDHSATRPPRKPKFSLLARPPHDESALDTEEDENGAAEQTMTQEDVENARKVAEKTREERLQHDLFILRKLNSAFEVYKEALIETKSSTERVAAQIANTNALLDRYVKILSRSEGVARLILDERWQGAGADEEAIEQERLETIERLRREEEERVLAAQREHERLEREAEERQKREERERLEREQAELARKAPRGSGVRGVRGTRASMRGMRAASRAGTTSTRGTRIIRGSSIGRPSSSTMTRSAGSTSGVSRRI